MDTTNERAVPAGAGDGSKKFTDQPKQNNSNINETQPPPTVSQFMAVVFNSAVGVPIVAAPDFKGFTSQRYRDGYVRGEQVYFCISTVKDIPRHAFLKRQLTDLVRTYAIVLDDCGTKVPLPAVPPTWVIESSPGNFQYGYRLEGGADPAAAAALIDSLIAARLTDPGAGGANRVMRLPGSLNAKPQHNGWRARVTVWQPQMAYTVATLAQGFAVVPRAARAPAADRHVQDGPDPVFDWLIGAGMIKDGPNARGWYGLMCPWEENHQTPPLDHGTDYRPGDPGAFKCLHGSCASQSTATLKAWILEQDPDADIGVINHELVAKLGKCLRKILGDRALSPLFDKEHVAAVVEADLVHVAQENKYWSIQNQGLVEHRALDDILTPIMKAAGLLQRGTKQDMPPHVWLRRNPRIRRVSKLTHRLGAPLIVGNCLNIAPPIPEPEASEAFARHGVWAVANWLRLVLFICRHDKTDAGLFLDWAAMVVSAWSEKPGWAIMLKGATQGTGKNLALQPIVATVGVEHYQEVTAVTLSQQFNPYLTKRLIVVDEIRSTTRGSPTGHDAYAMLKAYIARGADTLTVNEKHRRPYPVANLSAWAFTSNEGAPLPLEASDRRLFVIETPNDPMPTEFYASLAYWYKAGGHAACAAYLRDRWKRMSEKRKHVLRTLPPMTQAKLDVIEMSDEGINTAVRAAISGKYDVCWRDLMTLADMLRSIKFDMLNAGMVTKAVSDNVNNPRLIAALKSVGATRLNNGNPCGRDKDKVRLWLLNPRKRQMYEALGFGAAMYEKWVELNPRPLGFGTGFR
jgi:hypothetical protein